MGRKESERWRRRLAAVFRESAALWERWRDCSQVALVSSLHFEAVAAGVVVPPASNGAEFLGAYGPSYLHKLHDAAGNALVWFSSDSANNIAPGRTVWVKASVKKHEEGAAQTTLTRLTEVSDEDAAAELVKAERKAARTAAKAQKTAAATA